MSVVAAFTIFWAFTKHQSPDASQLIFCVGGRSTRVAVLSILLQNPPNQTVQEGEPKTMNALRKERSRQRGSLGSPLKREASQDGALRSSAEELTS